MISKYRRFCKISMPSDLFIRDSVSANDFEFFSSTFELRCDNRSNRPSIAKPQVEERYKKTRISAEEKRVAEEIRWFKRVAFSCHLHQKAFCQILIDPS